jgi:hypothetical protein
MNETVIFILRSVIDIYASVLLIRLLLQLVQAISTTQYARPYSRYVPLWSNP